jgi:hypothetical protein
MLWSRPKMWNLLCFVLMIRSNSKLLELSGKYKENRAQEPAMFGGKLSFILSQPCALNAEFWAFHTEI